MNIFILSQTIPFYITYLYNLHENLHLFDDFNCSHEIHCIDAFKFTKFITSINFHIFLILYGHSMKPRIHTSSNEKSIDR
jgi:hypothetical protein